MQSIACTCFKPILVMQDEYDAEYDKGLRRRTTMRKQASMARQQSTFQDNEDLRPQSSGFRAGFSSLGPRTQSLAPFQVKRCPHTG